MWKNREKTFKKQWKNPIRTNRVSLCCFLLYTGHSAEMPSFFAAFLNTLFFMGVLLICYWNTEFIQGINETLGGLNPLMFVVAFVGVNGALEMPSSCIVGGIVSKAVNRALYTKKEA